MWVYIRYVNAGSIHKFYQPSTTFYHSLTAGTYIFSLKIGSYLVRRLIPQGTIYQLANMKENGKKKLENCNIYSKHLITDLLFLIATFAPILYCLYHSLFHNMCINCLHLFFILQKLHHIYFSVIIINEYTLEKKCKKMYNINSLLKDIVRGRQLMNTLLLLGLRFNTIYA